MQLNILLSLKCKVKKKNKERCREVGSVCRASTSNGRVDSFGFSNVDGWGIEIVCQSCVEMT